MPVLLIRATQSGAMRSAEGAASEIPAVLLGLSAGAGSSGDPLVGRPVRGTSSSSATRVLSAPPALDPPESSVVCAE